jgi:hypothetical protein
MPAGLAWVRVLAATTGDFRAAGWASRLKEGGRVEPCASMRAFWHPSPEMFLNASPWVAFEAVILRLWSLGRW